MSGNNGSWRPGDPSNPKDSTLQLLEEESAEQTKISAITRLKLEVYVCIGLILIGLCGFTVSQQLFWLSISGTLVVAVASLFAFHDIREAYDRRDPDIERKEFERYKENEIYEMKERGASRSQVKAFEEKFTFNYAQKYIPTTVEAFKRNARKRQAKVFGLFVVLGTSLIAIAEILAG